MNELHITTAANGYIVETYDEEEKHMEEHVFTVFQHLVDFLTNNLYKPTSVVSQAH